ncbi:MAG: nucleoside triphosphate pyrophosphohydrolase [Sphingomonadales bacterium]
MEKLIKIMARLRDPDGGCPWDLEQDFKTIAPYTIEEAYEVAEAIDAGDRAALRDELGDLLFQVVYHARLAEEEGAFTFDDVVTAISEKMIRRHPHVFAKGSIADAEAQTAAWEDQKASERDVRDTDEPVSILDDVPSALPSLLRAEKLQKRAARVGFDWPEISNVVDKLREELGEIAEAIADNSGTAKTAGAGDEQATVKLGTDEATVKLDDDETTVKLGADPATVKLDDDAATVKLGTGTAFEVVDDEPIAVKLGADAIIEGPSTDRVIAEPGTDRVMEELGDFLFAAANLARHLKLNPEEALRRANRKFINRFQYIEQAMAAEGRKLDGASLEEMEELWQAAKRAEKSTA